MVNSLRCLNILRTSANDGWLRQTLCFSLGPLTGKLFIWSTPTANQTTKLNVKWFQLASPEIVLACIRWKPSQQMSLPGKIDCFGRREGNVISDFLPHKPTFMKQHLQTRFEKQLKSVHFFMPCSYQEAFLPTRNSQLSIQKCPLKTTFFAISVKPDQVMGINNTWTTAQPFGHKYRNP